MHRHGTLFALSKDMLIQFNHITPNTLFVSGHHVDPLLKKGGIYYGKPIGFPTKMPLTKSLYFVTENRSVFQKRHATKLSPRIPCNKKAFLKKRPGKDGILPCNKKNLAEKIKTTVFCVGGSPRRSHGMRLLRAEASPCLWLGRRMKLLHWSAGASGFPERAAPGPPPRGPKRGGLS